METVLIIISIILAFTGIAGCLLPFIPGPPLSYAGLLLLHLTTTAQFSTTFLFVVAALVIFVSVADYLFPVAGAHIYGASKQGTWGSFIGLFAGLFFFPPLGLIIGPIAGAFVGELFSGRSFNLARKAALGTIISFLVLLTLKLILCGYITWHVVIASL